MKRYTLVTDGEGRDRFEALYSDGQLIKEGEDGPLTAAEVLEALALDNITVRTDYEAFDSEGALDMWPQRLDEISFLERRDA